MSVLCFAPASRNRFELTRNGDAVSGLSIQLAQLYALHLVIISLAGNLLSVTSNSIQPMGRSRARGILTQVVNTRPAFWAGQIFHASSHSIPRGGSRVANMYTCVVISA
ncbi:hypothetical protein PHLCEN_2v9698 [Hermanssonia centrifuga]|uniref:Uncharacterized protein n=1 Tax=Hermanssonia centrifuga TaxID=98765 RepID=A0A2R6NQV5_9APHY|nr:hypothetical protein PHLCEN_2v9698 [Hermanssonia centrifuga]